ncbi:hypothetical protein [Mahella sp.]|uniref:hypothetical protein n=1 Tax=Mahella sp. TaxID=2798721 RepID=UPI0025B920C3|nr:hypothetical protein [Mahella sp.]MBZ4664857.1 hypothetical protein [Mahella sp.]
MLNKVNLDYEAAKIGNEIVMGIAEADKKDIERCVTKALGILQTNGVYASLLYMCAATGEDEKISRWMMEKLLEISEPVLEVHFQNKSDPKEVLNDVISKVLSDIDSVLLIKELWEQTLIYARYNARAR